MKLLLVSCLLLFSFNLRAQSSLEAIQQTMTLFDKGDYQGTINVAERALPQIKQEFGETSPFYSGMIFFLAISHFKLYHYEKAEPYFLKQMDLIRQTNGENNLNFIASLNGLALLYRETGKYTKAEALYQKSINIAAAMTGTNDTAYAKSVNNLASLYQLLGQYSKAEQLFNQSARIISSLLGENSAMYATSLNNLATLYADMGQPLKAKPLAERVIQVRKITLGERHPDYAGALNNLAFVLAALGNFKESEKLFLQAKEIYRAVLGSDDPDYASSINNLAELYKTTGQYDKAEQLYLQSREIRRKTVGIKHPDYALSLNNLAGLYQVSGQYDKAVQLFQQAKDIITTAVGEEHPYYVTSINNMAALYDATGDYAKAEPLYLRSLEIRKRILGITHPAYAMSLNNLATLYQEIGQYKKAEPLYLQAREIWKNSVGINHPDYAMCTNNLGSLYEELGDLTKAEAMYIQARDIQKAVYGTDHVDYATSLNNLAGLYARKGDYKKAEPLLIQAKDIWKKMMGDNNPVYATALNNLAALYRKSQTNLVQSEQLYLQSLTMRQRVLGVEHPLTADVENDLALLYMNRAMPEKAVPYFIHSSNTNRKNLVKMFPVLSEKEKGNYIARNQVYNECDNSLLYLYPRSRSLINNNLDLQLFFKSLSLSDTRNMLDMVRNSSDSSLKRIFYNWQNTKALIAKQNSLPSDQRMPDLSQKEDEAESMEKELARKSAAFRGQQAALQVTMKDVQQNLDEDEAAIEFVSFKLYNKKSTDSIIYAAYVYRKHDTVATFLPLFEEQQLQRILDSAGKTATGIAKVFYRGIDVRNRTGLMLDKDLYKLIWQPIESTLGGIKKVSYSPSGKLYGIAFHALRIDSSTLLMDKYTLRQYTSTRNIAMRNSQQEARPGSIALFGNPNFTMDSLELVTQHRKGDKANDISNAVVSRGNNSGTWPDLPGTADEVKRIADLFKSKKLATREFIQGEASEENFKMVGSNAPQTIHIATHGFFLKDRSGDEREISLRGLNQYSIANDPLMRSGLILSGGNYAWAGNNPVEGVEDGIVTAYEISQLNLSNTQLVVLSACETALGDIKGNEGVFGLQRAFKMAGVRKMIVSLWQVPDKETAELMSAFYGYWLKGKTIEGAFTQAQADMRSKYSPYYWAAFVLVE